MKKLIWRLKEQPTTEALRELVKDKILTNEEAREILFSSEEATERDKASLEAEIKFLRELVDRLSNRSQIIETIKQVEVPYKQYPWFSPYIAYCSNDGITRYVEGLKGNITDGTIGRLFASISTW